MNHLADSKTLQEAVKLESSSYLYKQDMTQFCFGTENVYLGGDSVW